MIRRDLSGFERVTAQDADTAMSAPRSTTGYDTGKAICSEHEVKLLHAWRFACDGSKNLPC